MVKTLNIPTFPINQTNYRSHDSNNRTSTRRYRYRKPSKSVYTPPSNPMKARRRGGKNWKREKEISQMIVYQNNGSGTMAAYKSAFTYDPFLISAFLKTSPSSANYH